MNRKAVGGFTLHELMLVVALLSLLAGITIPTSLNSWRNAQISALAIGFAGWLEQISRAPESIGTPCIVTLSTSAGTLTQRAVVAQVSPATCSPDPTFTVSNRFGNQPISMGASITSISFTPRQAISSTSDIQVRFALLNQAPVRCVRLSAILGLIRIGRNDSSSSTASDCPATSFDTL